MFSLKDVTLPLFRGNRYGLDEELLVMAFKSGVNLIRLQIKLNILAPEGLGEIPVQSEMGKAFWFLGVVWIVPAMTFAGYLLGKEYGKPVIGALVGTLVGIFLLFVDVARMSGILKRKSSKP
jgi:hypothetical protein